ncbi:hypothetical protein EVAR_75909_1 [Eumeta japonica]|uniref:Uncharacterized protein n=1 Tax=Eumeta variegata TaxID=151549 RepID=A0A4C1UW79_EUMVA|nr:hypothetical protein EVAR_75909_1 [Eumeta japonica]
MRSLNSPSKQIRSSTLNIVQEPSACITTAGVNRPLSLVFRRGARRAVSFPRTMVVHVRGLAVHHLHARTGAVVEPPPAGLAASCYYVMSSARNSHRPGSHPRRRPIAESGRRARVIARPARGRSRPREGCCPKLQTTWFMGRYGKAFGGRSHATAARHYVFLVCSELSTLNRRPIYTRKQFSHLRPSSIHGLDRLRIDDGRVRGFRARAHVRCACAGACPRSAADPSPERRGRCNYLRVD